MIHVEVLHELRQAERGPGQLRKVFIMRKDSTYSIEVAPAPRPPNGRKAGFPAGSVAVDGGLVAPEDGCSIMDSDSIILQSAKLVGLLLFVYGLIVFANEGAGELLIGGVALVVSPYIWGSSWAWPGCGVAASQGLLLALTGFFVLRLKTKRSDFASEVGYVWPFLRAILDTLILLFAWCLTWEVLLSIFEPGAGYLGVTEFFYSAGVTNTFVMYFSAIMLPLLSAFKLGSYLRERGRLGTLGEAWRRLVPKVVSRRFTLSIALLSLSLGAVILLIAFYFANPFNILDTFNGFFYCNEECYFMGTLDFVGAGVGAILMVVGAVASIELLLPGEATLW